MNYASLINDMFDKANGSPIEPVDTGSLTSMSTHELMKSKFYTGYSVVGSPVIVNGILTPSEGNYVTTNVTFPATVPDVWELRTKCIRVTDELYQDLAMTLGTNDNRVRSLQLEYTYAAASLVLSVFAGTGGSSWNVMNGTSIRPAFEKDVWYWVRVGYDGTYYYMEYSADGATYTRVQYRSATHIGAFNAIAFGRKGAGQFTGSIDLAETAFYIDGELFWKAI